MQPFFKTNRRPAACQRAKLFLELFTDKGDPNEYTDLESNMTANETVLITGGAGYIGSHTAKQLIQQGYRVISYDNLVSGNERFAIGDEFIEGDIGNQILLRKVFEKHQPDSIIHFAAHCRVGESVTNPRKYYDNNVAKGLSLLEVARDFHTDRFIFSSSAAIYGDPKNLPITEQAPKKPKNPYGRTKWFFENVLKDYTKAYNLTACSLRYFNAAGADPEGEIGEIHDPETHLIPVVLQAAAGQRDYVEIFGQDYETPDGTPVRDFIHVNDLASAHISSLKKLAEDRKDYLAYNLGTGKGHSVREVIDLCKKVTGIDFPVKVGDRRAGDPPKLVADPQKAFKELNWRPHYQKLAPIIETSWNWFKNLYDLD